MRKITKNIKSKKRDAVRIRSSDLLCPDHFCKPIARAIMSDGRDWWVGELIKLNPDYPEETHCLHMKTPLKSVVFLCNKADFQQLTILSRAVIGKLDETWLDRVTEIVKGRT